MRTVVGLFNQFEDAQQVVKALSDVGFNKEDINLIASDPNGDFKRYMDLNKQGQTQDVSQGASAGAGVGAVLGGLGGLLVGLGALAIPGVGPIIAAGPIVSTLAGAGAGAVAGGIVGALVNMGIPKEHAEAYAEGIRRGGALVTVRTPDERSDEAARIMEQYNPVDIKQQMKQWQPSRDEMPQTEQTMTHDEERQMNREAIPVTGDQGTDIPVIEEELNVGKQTTETGGVRVEKNIKEEPVEKNVELRHEHINVERRPVNREATEEDLNAFQEGSMELEETDERVVAEKRPKVVEEIHVDKDVDIENRTVRDTLRKDEVNIEQTSPQDFNRFEQDFRNHFYNTYSSRPDMQDVSFDDYLPAYRYGYNLSNEDRFANADWSQVEPQARMDWERRYGQGTWDRVKDAIQYAWDTTH